MPFQIKVLITILHLHQKYVHLKNPTEVKSKKENTFGPIASAIGQKAIFEHGLCVGKMQLKYMASGFNIHS